MAKKVKRTFRFSVRIKGTDKVFAEGFEPGVIATQDVTYTAEPEEFKSPMFIRSLIEAQEDFLKEHAEVNFAEVE